MLRREFLKSLAGLVTAAPLAAFGMAPARNLVDGCWHFLRIMDGVATVDGQPWAKPWLVGRFLEDDKFHLWLRRPWTQVEIGWFRAWSFKDGSGPTNVEMVFKARPGKKEVRLAT